MNWNGRTERLGIFGGTFDPPHIGHLILAQEAQSQAQLDRVLWVLTPYPPHKERQPITPWRIRLKLVESAIQDDRHFELSRADIDRKPPHYAVDTVKLIRTEFPAARLIYLMGGDSLADLPDWHTPADFVAACDELAVMGRPGWQADLTELESVIPGLSVKVSFVETTFVDISSNEIRQRISTRRPYRYFLPAGVYDLIQKRGYYKNLER